MTEQTLVIRALRAFFVGSDRIAAGAQVRVPAVAAWDIVGTGRAEFVGNADRAAAAELVQAEAARVCKLAAASRRGMHRPNY